MMNVRAAHVMEPFQTISDGVCKAEGLGEK